MIVRKLEALFTINTNAIQFKRAAYELDNLATKAETVMKAVAGYWAVQALQTFVANTASAMAEVGKSASFLGITADALQELRYAAEKSGVTVDALKDALKELQVRAVNAKFGEGEAAEAFQMLGLKSIDAAGRIREPLELLDAVADRLKALQTQSDRIWIADAIFGDEGSTVLSMLKDGSHGLRAMRKEAHALGIILGPDAIAKANRFNQALKKLHTVSIGIGKTLVEYALPSLSWLMERLSGLALATQKVRVSSSLFNIALLSLSATLAAVFVKAAIAFTPMLIAAAPLIAKISLITLGITALVAVIEDIWMAFNGGNSVFGLLWQNMNAFFAPFEQKIAELPGVISRTANEAWKAMTKGFTEAWASMEREFLKFSRWFDAKIANLIPDFLKQGFAATINHVNENASASQNLNRRLAPQLSQVSHQNRISSQQNVNVAVNVKSGSDPHEIGSEVSKAIKQALERERFNAFMGVMNYAG